MEITPKWQECMFLHLNAKLSEMLAFQQHFTKIPQGQEPFFRLVKIKVMLPRFQVFSLATKCNNLISNFHIQKFRLKLINDDSSGNFLVFTLEIVVLWGSLSEFRFSENERIVFCIHWPLSGTALIFTGATQANTIRYAKCKLRIYMFLESRQ